MLRAGLGVVLAISAVTSVAATWVVATALDARTQPRRTAPLTPERAVADSLEQYRQLTSRATGPALLRTSRGFVVLKPGDATQSSP